MLIFNIYTNYSMSYFVSSSFCIFLELLVILLVLFQLCWSLYHVYVLKYRASIRSRTNVRWYCQYRNLNLKFEVKINVYLRRCFLAILERKQREAEIQGQREEEKGDGKETHAPFPTHIHTRTHTHTHTEYIKCINACIILILPDYALNQIYRAFPISPLIHHKFKMIRCQR